MDDWMPIITASIAIVGTLLGASLSGLLLARTERQRRDAEAIREAARAQREDEATEESKETEAREADAVIGTEIAALFFESRRHVLQFGEGGESEFNAYFDRKWDTELQEQIRMKVGRVRDNEARSRLIAIVDSLLDYQPLAPFSGSISTRRFVDDAFLLGAELALAISRGQQPESGHAQQFDSLKQTLSTWDAFLERQAQERAQRERERLAREEAEERRQYRLEEADFDMRVDLEAESRE
ncbi:hypothetical protein E3O44_17150 [Cryobacterium algoricola]|uniref:DUF4760 domain-containing protein n=1 Tax=Cryobacterium algoricola TaxID=1259183 RepID=A0ABY2I9Z1_9MICO|nr:hypothetical protein [Cryobacterium algoricola]TFB83602.1 hypothetical protein E3O44_17150 [Cryobacterium algoricola]